MYDDIYYTTTRTAYNYGIWGIIACVIAIIGGICLYFTVFSDKNEKALFKLLDEKRTNVAAPADYTEGSFLDTSIKDIIGYFDIVLMHTFFGFCL